MVATHLGIAYKNILPPSLSPGVMAPRLIINFNEIILLCQIVELCYCGFIKKNATMDIYCVTAYSCGMFTSVFDNVSRPRL